MNWALSRTISPRSAAASLQREQLTQPNDRSARAHLLIFAGALLLPVLLFAGLLGWFYVTAERERAENRAVSAARELIVAVDRELAAPRLMLQALATSPYLQTGDLEAFHTRASEIARAVNVTIVLRAPGHPLQLLNTAVPWGTPLAGGNADISSFEQEVMRTKQPIVSDLIRGPLQQLWVVVVMIPVLRNGEVIYLLSVGIPANRFAEVLRQVELGSERFSVVVDRRGVVIARSVDHDRFVSKPAPMGWVERATGSEGLWTGRNLEGIDVRTAYARSRETNWIMAVGVPRHVLSAPLRRAFLVLASVGAALLGLAGALAYRTGSTLSRSIGSLGGAGAAVARGEQASLMATPVREVNDVGKALSSAANEVIEREAHLRSILDTVPSAMVVIDSRGAIQSFSRAAEKLFGYSADEVLGRNVSLLMPEPDQRAHDGYIARYLATGERRIIGLGRVVAGLRKDGTAFPIELNIGEAGVNGAKIFTGFIRDLTEKHRMEQELRQTQKMEAIGKLTGGVAHDFNNLLTVIKGNLEMLETGLEGKRYQELITDAQEATDLAAELIKSLLAFGRRMPLNPTIVDVGKLVSGTSDLMRRTLGETIAVRTTIESSCSAFVDAAQLQNALLNLGINARDAMPEGGKLTIEVSEAELDADYAKANPEVQLGRYVLVSVTDNGTGMPPEVKERAFEPFFTTKPTGSGTGLGLSSVYGFVKQSDGHITLYSEPELGTTIRIYLPCPPAAEVESKEQITKTPAALPASRGETILVVEDEARVRRITAARLKELGYQVLEAETGVAALDVLARNAGIDLLFTDMVMPGGMSGAQLAAEAHRAHPGLRVLLTSGYADVNVIKQANAESRNWLRKPYTAADLARKVRSILDREAEGESSA